MKYEVSDLLNEEYNLDLIKLRVHKKVKHKLIAFLYLKQCMSNYKFIHIIYIIFSSMSLLILSNEFIPHDNNKYFSDYFRELTFFSLVKKLKLTHSTYLIICAVIFIICIIRFILLATFISKCNQTDLFNSIKTDKNLFARIINQIVYVLFPYIIEFLSFIFYIEIFPKDFVIKFIFFV